MPTAIFEGPKLTKKEKIELIKRWTLISYKVTGLGSETRGLGVIFHEDDYPPYWRD